MIQQHCFEKIWIDSKQSELRLRDPGLLEKCIYALQLLGLLADKLTAFAPNTVGVRLTPDSNMQVIKQVVDVGELFTKTADLTLIRQAYAVICDAEIGYRGGAFTSDQSLRITRYPRLNRLKATNPEAFFYWHKVDTLLRQPPA